MGTNSYQHANKHVKRILLLILLVFQSANSLAETHLSLTDIVPHKRITIKIKDTDRVTLGGHRLPQLEASEDKGAVDDNLILKNIILVLSSSPQQQAALDAFTRAQQNPGDPEYHHWLTPQEFANHFGVASQDLNTLKNYLLSKGFMIEEVHSGGRSIAFSGTAAQIKNVFHTEIHHFVWQGEPHIANVGDPQIPAALSPVVEGIINLHDFYSRARKPNAKSNPFIPLVNPLPGGIGSPISNWTTVSNAHYLSPGDYGVIYNINPLYASAIKGNGIIIAVLGRSNILASDVSSFQSTVGLPSNPPQIIINGADPGLVNGDQMESTLDVEWTGGVAPGATVKFITSANTLNSDGIGLSAIYAVNNNIGNIISLSYGACESAMGSVQVNAWSSLWQQAQSQGQTVLVSSGDSGAAGCDASGNATAVGGAGVNGLCSSQYSTCVGGTQFNDTANPSTYWQSSGVISAKSYIPEMVWNESGSTLWASGGGASIYFAKPGWQVSPGVPLDGVRDVPDVALSAAGHDGYIIYFNGQLYSIGGTSAATPAFAGIMALQEQYNGGRQGNINPTLYGLYQKQANGGSYAYFHPTLSGNNSVPGQAGFSANGSGYNLATGLGSVDANLLVRQWRNFNPSTTRVVLSTTAAQLMAGQTVTLTATVTGFLPTGSIQFKNGSVVLGTAILSNGVASLTTNALTKPGSNSVVAIYTGDGNNLASSSATLIEAVTSATTVTVTASSATVAAGQSLILTATVTGASPTGTVQFYSNSAALGAPVTLVNGIAVLTTNGLTSIGLDSITASYSGDSNNAPNSSLAINETVTAAQVQQVPALAPWQEQVMALILLCLLIVIQRKVSIFPVNLRQKQTK